MFTAIILMCSVDTCYTIINQSYFFKTPQECQQAIADFISGPDFDPAYRFFEEGRTYNVMSTRCVSWDETSV